MTDVGRLAAALADRYRLDRELGEGGMATVFLAEDLRHHRQVALKVLKEELGASIGPERFHREIEIAARLHHPHILPLYDSGEADGFLFYVMPFVEGESLRAKLNREGQLPVADAVRVLREVADALAYAHELGIVHRDIKPDNVMMSRGHALVADFGVAKAVSESAKGASLTTLGVALGTPAYMAPEQASADPHVDHRADLYALGAMAYEMLAGRTPFTASSPQAMLAAHVTRPVEALSLHRPAVSPGLESLVMRCLAKLPADRWQSAAELLPHLEGQVAPSGVTQPTAPLVAHAPSSGTQAALLKTHPVRVALLFALAAVGVLALVYLVVQQAGLPDWVFIAAIGLLVIGAPIVLLTGHHERRRAIARATSKQVATPTGLQRHLTWRKALLGGLAAFAGLGLIATIYTVMRLTGIGPVGTLVAKGTLSARERIVLAEFENGTADSSLGSTVTELLRIDLSQSPMLTVYDASQVSSVLARMQLSRDAEVTFDIAREIATREGVKAVLAGDIRTLANGYVLSARLVGTSDGEILWAGRQDVADAAGLSAAIERLSATLRERVGESLRSIRGDAPLDQFTTGSLEALRAYVQAEKAQNAGDGPGGIALLERAIALDTGFAMAYRKLGVLLFNQREAPGRRDSAFSRAYALRDRVSVRERYLTEAAYHQFVENDTTATIATYQALLEKFPDDIIALNNLATRYSATGRRQDALRTYKRSIALGAAPAVTFGNAIPLEYELGDPDTAWALLERYRASYAGNPQADVLLSRFLSATRAYDSSKAVLEALRARVRGNTRFEQDALFGLASLAGVRGQLAESRRWLAEGWRVGWQRDTSGLRGLTIRERVELDLLEREAFDLLLYQAARERGLALLDGVLRRDPVERRPSEERWRFYAGVANAYADFGEATRARDLLAQAEREAPDSVDLDVELRWARSRLAFAEGRHAEAVELHQRNRERFPNCETCNVYEIAEAYDQMGEPDSAIAYFRKLIEFRGLGIGDRRQALVLRRLGQLHEQKGDKAKALEYYGRFVELWKDADHELQPKVGETRRWIAQLAGERPQ